jgi:hypothetical protein
MPATPGQRGFTPDIIMFATSLINLIKRGLADAPEYSQLT